METQRSRALFHIVLIEPSSADTPELGGQTRGWRLETGAWGGVEGWAWGMWLTFQPAGTWGLGLHVSLVWNLVWESDKERPSLGPFQDVAICLPPCGLSPGI